MPALKRVGLVVLAVLVASTPAAADGIDKARAAIDSSDYLAARGALAEALAAGKHGPEQLAEIYRLTGIVAGALGDAAAATEAFQRCLALAPKTTLPVGTSPKIAKPFARAQAATKEQLKIKSDTVAAPPSVNIAIVGDPLAMTAKIRVIVAVDGAPERTIERPVDRAATAGTTIALPPGKRLDLRIAALDASGNRLAELGSVDVPIVILGPAGEPAAKPSPPKSAPKSPPETATDAVVRAPAPAQANPRPIVLRWWLWGGAAVAFGGAGAYFGVDVLRARNEIERLGDANRPVDEARAVESRAKRSAVLANVGLIAGGTFAVAATVLYLTAPRGRASERRATLRPVPVPGGAALVFGGQL